VGRAGDGLALALLVAGILADDADDTGAADDAAAFAKSFHGWSNFHGKSMGSRVARKPVRKRANTLIIEGFAGNIQAASETGTELLA